MGFWRNCSLFMTFEIFSGADEKYFGKAIPKKEHLFEKGIDNRMYVRYNRNTNKCSQNKEDKDEL